MVDDAFSTKPCYISSLTSNKPEGLSCVVWSQECYGGANSLKPGLCKVCNTTSSELTTGENTEKIKEEEEPLFEPKIEADFDQKDADDADFTNFMEGELSEFTDGKEHTQDTQKDTEEHCDGLIKSEASYKDVKHSTQQRSRVKHVRVGDNCYKCGHCGEAFKSMNMIRYHVEEAHRKVPYDCDKCGKSFKNSGALHQHMTKVHMKERLKKQCNICGERCSNEENLATHVRRKHTGEKPFDCPFCEETFFSAQDAYSHKACKHPDSYAADQKRKSWLKKNPTMDPSKFMVNCHLCNEVRATVTQLREHWAEVHPGLTDKPIRPVDWLSKNNTAMCDVCGSSYKNSNYLKIHTFEKHEPEGRVCPICKEELPDRDQALLHVKIKHKARGAPSQQRNAVCDLCGYVGTMSSLRVHMKRNHGSLSRPTTCTYCEKEFPKYETMNRHRRKAHPEQWMIDRDRLMREEGSAWQGKPKDKWKEYPSNKKATCDICGVTLCTRQQLNSHMKARHGTGLPGYGLMRGRPL